MIRTSSIAVALGLVSTAAAQVDLSIAVRETEAGSGAAFTNIGDNGGAAGGIEWVNRDGQQLVMDGSWQLFTFDLANDTILGFAGSTANSILDGTYGTLEHIRLKSTGGLPGNCVIWIDDVTNTIDPGTGPVPTNFGSFEGFADGDEVIFQEPCFSGSTAANVAGCPNPDFDSAVDNSIAFTGSGSCRVNWQYSTGATAQWVRLTSFGAANSPNPQIRFDQGSQVSFWARGIYCDEFNGGTGVSTSTTPSGFVGANPVYRSYQFTPLGDRVLESAQLFTAKTAGSQDDYCRIEIWADDGAGLPDGNAVLGSGTLFSEFQQAPSWLGTTFDRPVPIVNGTPYWLVMVHFGGWTVPEDPAGGTLLPLATATNSRNHFLRTPAAAKIRLCTAYHEIDGASVIGRGCVNSLGRTGSLFCNVSPTAGNTGFYIEGTGFPAGEMASLAFGWDPFFPSLPLDVVGFPAGCFLHSSAEFGASAPNTGTAEIGDNAPNTPPPFGYVRVPFALLNTNPGFQFTVQLVVFDLAGSSPLPAVSSNGLKITVQ